MRRIAIVGTRKASAYAKTFAYTCAYELASRGFCIMSGLAFGIDAAAHRGALAAGGVTCAVLAHGLDTIAPEEHTHLALDILKHNGALISEYAEGTPAYPSQFLDRNRIISGLSEATIVIEAPRRSGAVHTGLHTLQSKKPLFVLPGSTASQQYAGSHLLIRSGGRLVGSLQDLFSDLGTSKYRNVKTSGGGPLTKTSDQYEQIIGCVQAAPSGCSVDTIAEHCTLKPQEVQAALAELILQGAIIEDGIGRYKITNI